MKTIIKEFERKNIYPVEALTKGLTPVLFDIETTGLNDKSSIVYLIGALLIKKDKLVFYQWFVESPKEELEVINTFLTFIPDNACLIHFNGRGFDVPYLSKKCKTYGIPNRLSQLPNVDLYRSFGPFKDYFDMDSKKLVAFERLIGIDREDPFNGGELISVYSEYIGRAKFDKEGSEKLLQVLLLHNEEDIRDMVPCLSLFSFLDLYAGNIKDCAITSSEECAKLEIEMYHPFPLVHTKTIATAPEFGSIVVEAKGNNATITIPIASMVLKHYFEDYKNYYYLPKEDTAIHKSVASCVDSDYREPATKATAFSKASGSFIPLLKKGLTPEFKLDLKDKLSFIPANSLSSLDSVKAYLKTLF